MLDLLKTRRPVILFVWRNCVLEEISATLRVIADHLAFDYYQSSGWQIIDHILTYHHDIEILKWFTRRHAEDFKLTFDDEILSQVQHAISRSRGPTALWLGKEWSLYQRNKRGKVSYIHGV